MLIGSSRQLVLPNLQPDQGQITWFRVYSFRLIALFRLAFASATHFKMLNLAGKSNSQVHYAKGTPSQLTLLRPLVGARFQGLFHSSIRSAFHLSFTVLVRYRSLGSIQPYRMVPADSRKIPRVPRYSGYHYASFSFEYRTITVYGFIFQRILLTKVLATSWSYNPNIAVTTLVWANPRSLATTWGIIIIFFSCRY